MPRGVYDHKNNHTNRGRTHTEEWKKKMSLLQKSIKHPLMAEETKEKLRKANLGKKHSQEWKDNLSKRMKGNKYSLGYKHSEEFKRRQSEYNKKIVRIPPHYSGKMHYNWQGGKSFEEYGFDWTESLKKIIRTRDNYKCAICNKSGNEVHHIDYNKNNCKPHNLITLCKLCHIQTNRNRNKWLEYFSVPRTKWSVCEVHSGLSALLVDKSNKYECAWVSSLTHSAIRGLPDTEIVPLVDRIKFVSELRRTLNKPIIVDVDNGGEFSHLPHIIKWFKEAGAYALIMEDKKGEKQNSLLDVNTQMLEDVDSFANKIKTAKEYSGNMKIIARVESLIAKHSIYEALVRAAAYVQAGADGIMIHSKQKVDASEIMEFADKFKKEFPNVLLVAVPTTYKLPKDHPFEIVITANHLLRASMKAMQKFINGEDVELSSVEDIFSLVGY
jgi:phosphoenolpyruvate phosphomutase